MMSINNNNSELLVLVESFNPDIINDLFKNLSKNSKIKIILDSDLFIFNNLNNFDEIHYNIFDYIVLKIEGYYFAFNRDFMLIIINLCKEHNLFICEISPNFDNFHGEKLLFENRVNFFTPEYANLFAPKPKYKFSYKKSYLLGVIPFTFSLIIFIFNYNYSKSILNINKKIALKYDSIKKYEKEYNSLKEIKSNRKVFEKYLNDTAPKIISILNSINRSSNKKIFYKKIEIEKSKIKIIGNSFNLTELYNLESELAKNGFYNINNDFIKNNESYFEFSIDCNIGESYEI